MADNQSLLENVQRGVAEQGETASIHQQIAEFKPDWSKYGSSQQSQDLLNLLGADMPAVKIKSIMQGQPGILQALLDALSLQDEKVVQWVLTLLYDLAREDCSFFTLVEDALKKKVDVLKPIMNVLTSRKGDSYCCDKAAWLLSGIMCHVPSHFKDSEATDLVKAASGSCSAQGELDMIGNFLKADKFRTLVWNSRGVADKLFLTNLNSAQSPVLYKSVFCYWLLSFDKPLLAELKQRHIVTKIKDILTASRVEKVVRICLTLLRNLLKHKDICEEVVEGHVLELVQGLEYEKWRDTELYDEIREVVALISHEVMEFSNFDRYERELQTGVLAWGFIHTSKFWAENINKFDHNEFGAIKKLAACLHSSDKVTVAVACHDIGEFVALHPLGKRKIAELAIKDRVMELMGSMGDDMRDVRREALLCCQKIMLNKWHEMDKASK